MIYSLLKPLLFSLDPENAHNLALSMAELCPDLGRLTGIKNDSSQSLKVGSIAWSFPVGLAAGLDKNAQGLNFFSSQGFGALECGTVTLKPQGGNPRPRMFRYPKDESLRNAMGFPNEGLEKILPRLKNYQGQTPLGINLGKNKETTASDSISEISKLLHALQKHADYFVINVSSPNTPGLRELQEKHYLSELFSELNKSRYEKDLYLKIAPDLSEDKIIELIRLCEDFHLTGIIATNTTIIPSLGTGGVSGKLLKEKSKEVRKIILRETRKLELIAVGGISEPEDLFDLWRQGGKAAQVYTSYVYQGPDLLKKFHHQIKKFLKDQQVTLEHFFNLPLEERIYRLNQRNLF